MKRRRHYILVIVGFGLVALLGILWLGNRTPRLVTGRKERSILRKTLPKRQRQQLTKALSGS
ncbi:MAG: hypothetical protein M2R45_01466 [Verrucomicrobia subdivision 3 bacterium]|nr:hypothetical protein [Limisphaerales bacterium]MCS1413404.1 hypothetical protein [Limisphaerales bacterium]